MRGEAERNSDQASTRQAAEGEAPVKLNFVIACLQIVVGRGHRVDLCEQSTGGALTRGVAKQAVEAELGDRVAGLGDRGRRPSGNSTGMSVLSNVVIEYWSARFGNQFLLGAVFEMEAHFFGGLAEQCSAFGKSDLG